MKCPHCGKDIPDDYGKEEERLDTAAGNTLKIPLNQDNSGAAGVPLNTFNH